VENLYLEDWSKDKSLCYAETCLERKHIYEYTIVIPSKIDPCVKNYAMEVYGEWRLGYTHY
jgi:hypothetical protein